MLNKWSVGVVLVGLLAAGCIRPGGERVGLVGKEAPETVGTDGAGEDLRLSDHRGKVVLLSFWGTH